MKIRVESFRGYYEPATCENFRECVDVMQQDLKKDFPKQESLWWLNVYLMDGENKLLLCQRYWQDGIAREIVMI